MIKFNISISDRLLLQLLSAILKRRSVTNRNLSTWAAASIESEIAGFYPEITSRQMRIVRKILSKIRKKHE